MSRLFFQTPEFIKLQKQWYKKLKNKGFDDIEVHKLADSGELMSFIPRASTDFLSSYDADTEEYFTQAREFKEHGEFVEALDSFIWGMHAEGLSYRDIIKELAKLRISRSVRWVCDHINRLKLECKKYHAKKAQEVVNV